MRLEAKGPIAPAPPLTGALHIVARTVGQWPGVISAAHWDLYEPTRTDGTDFYIGEHEIGHLHLYGEAHVATDRSLRDQLLQSGVARRFRFAIDPTYAAWVQCSVRTMQDADAAIQCFRANYLRLGGERAAGFAGANSGLRK